MRAMLTRRTVEQHNFRNEYDTRQALLVFLAARDIEWFRRDNRQAACIARRTGQGQGR